MGNTWVDFKAVKATVSMEMVLSKYGLTLRRVNQTYLRGRCPLPTHASKDSKVSFGVHTEKNAWACQSLSCIQARKGQKGGNVLDFVAAMEECSVRDAAVKLAEWFQIGQMEPSAQASLEPIPHSPAPPPNKQLVAEKTQVAADEPENKPLPFELRGIDPKHPYFGERGISLETAERFGVGYFPGNGSMRGRVVIPIHNAASELVAYAGRAIDGSEPRYKLPPGFHKSHVVFNLNRIAPDPAKPVVLVEGFFDCMKVVQAGFPALALMGSSLSERQESLLSRFHSLVLCLDGDEAGRTATEDIVRRLVRKVFIKIIDLPDGVQPDHLSAEELCTLLGAE